MPVETMTIPCGLETAGGRARRAAHRTGPAATSADDIVVNAEV